MASPAIIIKENDANMKLIAQKCRGKLCLQRDILNFIAKHEVEEEARLKAQAAGAPVLSKCEELIKNRSEAQLKKKRKKMPMPTPAVLLMLTEPISLLELSHGWMSLDLLRMDQYNLTGEYAVSTHGAINSFVRFSPTWSLRCSVEPFSLLTQLQC